MTSVWLFDLDGTLIDSNLVHRDAWCEAFVRHGYDIDPQRVFVEIGKGGDQLVPNLLGDAAERIDGDRLRKAHDKIFSRLAKRRGLAPAPQAITLLRTLRERGCRLALATSSDTGQMEVTEAASGVKWRELFDAVAGADDAGQSKPAPDVLRAAMQKLSVGTDECVMVGDTVWDGKAARAAHIAFLGVTYGGNSRDILLGAGARFVFTDTADILAHGQELLR